MEGRLFALVGGGIMLYTGMGALDSAESATVNQSNATNAQQLVADTAVVAYSLGDVLLLLLVSAAVLGALMIAGRAA